MCHLWNMRNRADLSPRLPVKRGGEERQAGDVSGDTTTYKQKLIEESLILETSNRILLALINHEAAVLRDAVIQPAGRCIANGCLPVDLRCAYPVAMFVDELDQSPPSAAAA